MIAHNDNGLLCLSSAFSARASTSTNNIAINPNTNAHGIFTYCLSAPRSSRRARCRCRSHHLPVKDSPLLGRDNVILTPHTGFYSVEALEELQTKCASDVARVLSGEKAVYPISV
jgi:lactate dehydrogenase-like 2-hydroxyacid dehydrogenase